MKVYVPKNHNKLLLSSIKHGECFWFKEELYMKIFVPSHVASCTGLKSFSTIYAVKLCDGVLFDFTTCPIVLMESDIAILESSKND